MVVGVAAAKATIPGARPASAVMTACRASTRPGASLTCVTLHMKVTSQHFATASARVIVWTRPGSQPTTGPANGWRSPSSPGLTAPAFLPPQALDRIHIVTSFSCWLGLLSCAQDKSVPKDWLKGEDLTICPPPEELEGTGINQLKSFFSVDNFMSMFKAPEAPSSSSTPAQQP